MSPSNPPTPGLETEDELEATRVILSHPQVELVKLLVPSLSTKDVSTWAKVKAAINAMLKYTLQNTVRKLAIKIKDRQPQNEAVISVLSTKLGIN